VFDDQWSVSADAAQWRLGFAFVADVRQLIERIEKLAATADSERKEERLFAASNSVAHYLCGIAGVVGGAVAAATASSSPTWVPVVAGITAAVGSGLLTLFKFEEKGRRRFIQERRYKSYVEHAQNEHARLGAESTPAADAAKVLSDLQTRLDELRRAAEP
jgi:hypothetical protein